MDNKEINSDFINPIHEDKVAENPGLLPYAHHVGSGLIKPLDKGRVKGLAMAAMYEQTDLQLLQLKQQMDTLVDQAKAIHTKIGLSEKIYQASMGFKPVFGKTYYLYRRSSGENILSMVSPKEWGNSIPYKYLATVKLLADHTWDIEDGQIEIITPFSDISK